MGMPIPIRNAALCHANFPVPRRYSASLSHASDVRSRNGSERRAGEIALLLLLVNTKQGDYVVRRFLNQSWRKRRFSIRCISLFRIATITDESTAARVVLFEK